MAVSSIEGEWEVDQSGEFSMAVSSIEGERKVDQSGEIQHDCVFY